MPIKGISARKAKVGDRIRIIRWSTLRRMGQHGVVTGITRFYGSFRNTLIYVTEMHDGTRLNLRAHNLKVVSEPEPAILSDADGVDARRTSGMNNKSGVYLDNLPVCGACGEQMDINSCWEYFSGRVFHSTGSCFVLVERLRDKAKLDS